MAGGFRFYRRKRKSTVIIDALTTLYNTFSIKIHVSPTGSDTTGNGSLATPYATVDKAVTMATSGSTAIILMSGTHALSSGSMPGVQNMGGGFLYDQGKALSFFGTKGETMITHTSSAREVHAYHGTNANTKCYNLIFKLLPNAAEQSAGYGCSIFGTENGNASKGTFYTCVFTSSSTLSFWYSNVNTHDITLNHCTIIAPTPLTDWNAPGSQLKLNSCVYTSGLSTNFVALSDNYTVSVGNANYAAYVLTAGVYSPTSLSPWTPVPVARNFARYGVQPNTITYGIKASANNALETNMYNSSALAVDFIEAQHNGFGATTTNLAITFGAV